MFSNSLPCTTFNSSKQQKITVPALLPASVPAKGGGWQEGDNGISCPPQVVNRSFDALIINYHINYLRTVSLWTRLAARKELLLSTTDNEFDFDFMQTNDEFGFSLQRMGKKFFPYRLRSGDITLCLSPREPENKIPNMSLEIGSLTCQGDLDFFFLRFKRFLRMLGCKVVSEVVGHVDICADIAYAIGDADIIDLSKQISRTEKTALYYSHKKFSGSHIGTGVISCRIYDKIREMDDKQANEKIIFFHEKWYSSGVPYNDVTRVEFQLRREFLKEIEITDFKSLVSKTNEIWAYCTEKWLRYTSQSIDRLNKNHKQSPVSEFWKIVQSAFFTAQPVKRDKVVNTCNMEALGKQIRGCMTTILASAGFDRSDFYGMIGTVRDFITQCMGEYLVSPAFAVKFDARQERYSSAF